MANYRLTVSYDGTRFFGWQKTHAGPSIEEELETAIAKILGAPKPFIQLEAASRTDRGVHAKGQVVCFHWENEIGVRNFQRSLNAVLPQEISVFSVQTVPAGFHPALSASSKEYHYWICNEPAQWPMRRLYSWHVPAALDVDGMRRAARLLTGQHDFSAFSNERADDAVRQVQKIDIIPDSGRMRIEMRADRFLYKMARNIAGTLVQVGRRKMAPDGMLLILESKDRKAAGVTAPAHGLFLMEVFYTQTT